jgi:hypothetical protein
MVCASSSVVHARGKKEREANNFAPCQALFAGAETTLTWGEKSEIMTVLLIIFTSNRWKHGDQLLLQSWNKRSYVACISAHNNVPQQLTRIDAWNRQYSNANHFLKPKSTNQSTQTKCHLEARQS